MMMVMARIILFVCFLLVMGGCGKKPVMYQDSLRITTAQELPSVDPQKVYNDGDYKVLEALFEGLVVPDPETMEALPGVAERWVVSEDGLVYEFFLREDARWSDGAPVVAEDFVFAVKRALSSKFICPRTAGREPPMARPFPLSMYCRKSAGPAIEKAHTLETPNGYEIDSNCFFALLNYAKANIDAGDNMTDVLYDVIMISYNLGFTKGGRAGTRGKFKEPQKIKKYRMV